MKNALLLFCLLFIATLINAQSLPDYGSIPLEIKAHYDDNANNAALQAANYLLSTPLDKENMNRLTSAQYLIKWMSGSPDYNFSLDASITKLSKKNSDLLVLYMAALAKYALENKADSKDNNKMKLNSYRILAGYVKNEKNNVKLTSELKKLVEANDNGQLEAYLKM